MLESRINELESDLEKWSCLKFDMEFENLQSGVLKNNILCGVDYDECCLRVSMLEEDLRRMKMFVGKIVIEGVGGYGYE